MSHLIIAYDSTKKTELGNLITNIKQVLQFSRLTPIITFDEPSSKADELILQIDEYLTANPTVTEVTLLNCYTDTLLVTKWKGFTPSSSSQVVKLINMPTVPRNELFALADSTGSMLLSENAELPASLLSDIQNSYDPPDANIGNKDFSLAAIQFYEMIRLYYLIGKEILNDFSSGSDIIYYAYKTSQYFTIYNSTDGRETMEVVLNEGNRLVGVVDFGEIEGDKLKVDTNEKYTPSVFVSYVYIDGLPKPYICNLMKAKTYIKPDTMNIILFSYRNYFSNDSKIIELTNSDNNIGYAFQAAKNNINNEVYIDYFNYYLYFFIFIYFIFFLFLFRDLYWVKD